jgi:hypothetical protein
MKPAPFSLYALASMSPMLDQPIANKRKAKKLLPLSIKTYPSN